MKSVLLPGQHWRRQSRLERLLLQIKPRLLSIGVRSASWLHGLRLMVAGWPRKRRP